MNSAALSALAGYSERLKSQYGLLYIDREPAKIKEDIRELILTNLNPPEDVDGLRLFKYIIDKDDPEALVINKSGPLPLSDTHILKTQILEYTKYLAPLDISLENYYGRLVSGENSDQFNELTENFKKSFNIVDFIEKQVDLDMAVNQLFKKCMDVYEGVYGGIYYNEDIPYVNRIKEPGWVFPSNAGGSGLQNILPDASELSLYSERLEDTSEIIDSCKQRISEITQTLIADLRNNKLEVFENYLDYADNNDSFYDGVVQEARDKLNFYKDMLGIIEADLSDYADLSNLLSRDKTRIDNLFNTINDIINGNTGLAQRYDDIILEYEEADPDLIYSVNPNNSYGGYISEFDAASSDALLEINRDISYTKVKRLVTEEVMSDFFNYDIIQSAGAPGLTISSRADDNIFSGFTGLWEGISFSPPFTDSVGGLIAAIDALSVTDTADPHYNRFIIDHASAAEIVRCFSEILRIADFADTIMVLTKDWIDSGNVSSDLPLEQFLINYYSMKTFKSFTATLDPTKQKRNLEGELLSGLTDHRDLTYELEYLLMGAPDENASSKYAGLTLYGTRMAECLSYMHTNTDAKKAVYFVTKMICEELPQLRPYFTEIKEAVAIFLAASEAAVEYKALKSGGSALILKASGEASADDFFYLNKFTSGGLSDGLTEIMENAVNDTRIKALAPAEPVDVHLRTSEFNYDAHLMMLLFAESNETKIQRIQDIIRFNQSEG
ncbi:MAG: DUF5702 domain-containing protein, partial [Clostridiales bacterium]|nr:DUF5702 domain-containing protein [Clostridiales bacterium]